MSIWVNRTIRYPSLGGISPEYKSISWHLKIVFGALVAVSVFLNYYIPIRTKNKHLNKNKIHSLYWPRKQKAARMTGIKISYWYMWLLLLIRYVIYKIFNYLYNCLLFWFGFFGGFCFVAFYCSCCSCCFFPEMALPENKRNKGTSFYNCSSRVSATLLQWRKTNKRFLFS